MVNVDPAEMVAIAETIFASRVQIDVGTSGVGSLKRLLPFIRQVHQAIAAERLTKGIEIICALDGEAHALAGAYQHFTNASALTAYFQGDSALTIQLVQDGLLVWARSLDAAPEFDFVGYRYLKPHSEVIFTREKTYEVPMISAGPSFFAIPYFRELKESLQEYHGTWIKNSVCEIFSEAWFDDKRTVFLPKPEVCMRRSLQRHLRSGLRELSGLNVMPEQNVNETRPVDIKVTWGAYNRVALIEIKWLGKSVHPERMAVTQEFAAGRAREGAEQLATYLDLYHSEAPHEEARGYLVVFDARRRGIRVPLNDLTSDQAGFYRYEEINYDPSILGRADFEHPLRFFCEPA
jgi:hypothetical protein